LKVLKGLLSKISRIKRVFIEERWAHLTEVLGSPCQKVLITGIRQNRCEMGRG
jgi:hypothetical protein